MNRQGLNEYTVDYEIISKNQDFINGLKSHKITGQSDYEHENTDIKTVQPYFFDPNTIELSQLEDFGLSEKIISNISKYRDAGGRFLNPIDMKKIYGLDEELFYGMEKWISIKPLLTKVDSSLNQKNNYSVRDSVVGIELNTVIFKDLIKLTGGDAKLTGRILNYRKLLGGFYSKNQLWEVFDMNDTIFNSIYSAVEIDTLSIVSLSLNNSEYSDLLRHPYLEKEDVNLILTYRKFKNANIDFDDFLKSKVLTDSTLQKMRPYLKK